MPNALEAAVAGLDLGLQHGTRIAAEQHVGMADDTGIDPGFAVSAAGALCRNAIGELDLADRLHRLRPIDAVHRAAVDIDGRDDIMPGRDIVGDVGQHVTLAGAVPQMMVRIDDRACRIKDVLGVTLEPVFAWLGIKSAAA